MSGGWWQCCSGRAPDRHRLQRRARSRVSTGRARAEPRAKRRSAALPPSHDLHHVSTLAPELTPNLASMQGSATSKPPRCRQARDASRHTPSRPRKCQRRARRDGPRKGRVGGTPSMSTSISNQSRSCRSRPSRLVAAAGSAGRCSCYAARICRGCSASAGEAGGGAVGRRAMHDRRRRAAEQWIRGGPATSTRG